MSILNEDQKTEARTLLESDVLKNVDKTARLAVVYHKLVVTTPINETFVTNVAKTVQVLVEIAKLDAEVNGTEFDEYDVMEWNMALELVSAPRMPSENFLAYARMPTPLSAIGSFYGGVGRGIAQGAAVAGVVLGGTWLIAKALRS